MTRTAIWREFESGRNPLLRLMRVVTICVSLFALVYNASVELTWPKQAVFGVVSALIAVWMDRSSSSYLITLTLVLQHVPVCLVACRHGHYISS